MINELNQIFEKVTKAQYEGYDFWKLHSELMDKDIMLGPIEMDGRELPEVVLLCMLYKAAQKAPWPVGLKDRIEAVCGPVYDENKPFIEAILNGSLQKGGLN